MPVSAACDRRKLAARLAAAAAIVLLGAGTMMPGATGQAVSPPYPGTDLRQDCRYQRRGAQPLRVGNVAGVDDAATTVSGSFAAAAACLDYSDNNGAILDVFLPIIVGAAQILAAAAARRPELAGICTLPLAMWITMDSNAVAADVLRRIAPNGELCACAGGLTAAEKLQLVALLLPMECHIDDQGGLPAALLGCPHMHGTAVDLGLECSYATAERGATLLVMFHLATAGRLALHQCGSPTRLTMQLYADGRDQSGDGGDGAATAGDLAPASLPWQPRYGFADDVSRSTILACEGEPAAPLVLISEWLEAGPHALLVSRGRNGGTDALANASDYIVGIRAFDDERRLLASTALSVRSDTTSMVGLSDGDTEPFGRKWSSIVHSPVSGLLYAAPYGAVSVLIIDPATNTADTTTISGLGDGREKWSSIVHSPVSGLLYAAPSNANSVLIIDPATNTTDTTTISGLGDGREKWSSIVHSPVSGLLYAAPYNAHSVLIIDPATNTADITTISDHGGLGKWSGIVHSPVSGLLYAAPYGAVSVLIIDPATNTADNTTISGFRQGRYKWQGIVHSPVSGLLYAAPYNAHSVLIIDPATNTADTTTISGLSDGIYMWRDIVHSPVSGLLYAAPYNANSVLIIDPATNTADTTAVSGLGDGLQTWSTRTRKWSGIVHSPVSGLLYAAPSDADSVLVVYPNPNGTSPTETDRCALRSQCATTCRASGCGWNDTQGLCRTSEVPTHVSAVQRGAGRHDGESCPVFRLNSTCADEIQAQFDAFQESEYFVLGVRKTIPVPDWSGTACGGGLHQTFADTSMFLSPTDQDYSTIIRAREFKITRDDGTALARDMYALTDPTTYEAFVSNMVPGNYTGRWIATDGGMQGDEPYPQRTVVATLPFEVRDYTITLKEGCRSELDAMVHNLSTSIYYVGDFLGVEGLSPGCTIAGGGFDGVNDPSRATFQVRITNTNDGSELDGAKLIDSSTGQMLIQPRLASAGGEYTAELQVRDGARPAQTFANWTIAPRRHVDSDDVTNGPNGRGCVNGAPLDRIEFDLQYACDCSGTEFTGDNCDVSPASELATVLGAGLGAVLGLIMIVLVSTRVQLYRLKHRPIDMEAVQGDVLAGLGIGVAKDILDHEFGIMLELAADQGDNMIADISAYQAQLVSAVAEYVPRLAHEFKQARISPSEHGPQKLLLVIPKPVASHTLGSIKGSIKGTTATTDVPEWTVAVLTKEISRRGGLPFGPTGSVVFVSLAMPNHVPREMNRSCLTRLAPLGSGAFGEVFLYEVNEPKRGIPPYQVAAKTVKPGGSMGRDELLKEAALMSLLNHRNVMALVGVVTVPRNLPALVLMVYCEGGELLGYVKNSSPDRLSTTKLLTFVAQIALGMQHISGCSIVHRDVAARNVLLDTMGRCKVADFGMSASLVHADKQYASEYVRVQEEIALRWAAPEALHEQRFSVQSDVWSFGVTVWELFAAGAEPYGELGLAEVGPFVKAGGRLEQPAGSRCPGQVYAEVIIPCWAHDASERPSFGELYDAAIRNGGVEDQVALDERAKPVHTSDFLSGDLRYQAPSVHYLSTKLLSDLTTAVTPTVQANLDGRGDPKARFPLLDVGDASSYHIKDYIVVPLTRHIMCSRDQLEGAIFVDTLSGADDVGPATAILSYAWKYPFRLVSGAMDEWCRADGLDPSLQYVWIDVLCWNQHGRLSDPVSEWETRVGAIGHQLTMLHPWNNPVYVTRAWCIFELWHAIGLGAKCNLGIILAPEDRIAFHDAITKEGYGIVDAALEHIRAESAEAFSADDLANITAKVKSTPGGFDTLNEVVKGRLRQWFESQGGMKARDLTVGFGVLTPTSSPPNSMNHVYTPASNSGSNASADRSPAQAAPAAMQPLSANHSTFGFPAQPESPASPKPQSGFGFDVDNAYDEEEDLPPASDAPDAIRLATSYTTFTV